MEAEYLDLKDKMVQMTGKNLDNFGSMVLLSDIFQEKYPDQIEYMAHFFRYKAIFKFLNNYRDELIREGFLAEEGKENDIKPQLIDSLCTLPYSLEQIEKSGDKSFTFLYSAVISATKAKLNTHLNYLDK